MSSRPLDELYEAFDADQAALLAKLQLEQIPACDRAMSPLSTYGARRRHELESEQAKAQAS